MKWFKHFSNASTSLRLNRLIDQRGLKGYAQYWLMLELLTDKFDGSNTNIHLHVSEIIGHVRVRNQPKVDELLVTLSSYDLLTFVTSGKFYEIDCPILFELQSRDSKYNKPQKRSERVSCDTKNKNIDLDKEEDLEVITNVITSAKKNLPKIKPLAKPKTMGALPEFSGNSLAVDFLKAVPQDTQVLWIQTYQDVSWLVSEFVKMVNWIAVNKQKAPKLVDRFANSWLTRSWESHRKTLPGQFSHQSHRTQSSLSDAEMQRARELGII